MSQDLQSVDKAALPVDADENLPVETADLESSLDQRLSEHMILNVGPSHPAMHGTVKMTLELDGETIIRSDVHLGYLHRGFEKESENGDYFKVFPYTDRLNYVSPMINNVAYAGVVEKALGVEVTERCKWIRVLVSEISRISDHLTCLGASAMELGAFTAFLYMIKAREYVWEMHENISGARMTVSYCRIGGVMRDLPDGFEAMCRANLAKVREVVVEFQDLTAKNRIFFDRMRGIGVMSGEDAINYGFTGPCLRASGVALDVRKATPYLTYDQIDFDVPVGKYGDNYDRFYVRMLELEQSIRIIEQVLDRMPEGPVNLNDPRFMLPPKDEVYNTIEGLVNHFKLVMHGIQIPRGETYFAVEGGNGELGFYLVSDGTGKPYKLRCRPPSFILMGGMSRLLEGHSMADVVPTFGMINMIGGECDR
jgi:NADH-quinone oxidoreductase subunit D